MKPNAQYDGIFKLPFRKWLGHESRALINGVSTLIKRLKVVSATSITYLGGVHSEKMGICELKVDSHHTKSASGTYSLQNMIKLYIFFVYKPCNLWDSVMTAWTDKDNYCDQNMPIYTS